MNPNRQTSIGSLAVASDLAELIENEVLAGTGVSKSAFWQGLERAVDDLAGRNKELLERRTELQEQIDQWLLDHPEQFRDPQEHEDFLRQIGYLLDEPGSCSVSPRDVDEEIAKVAGPQLVVPVDNARYALNAANARWGSLYDALYGTDAVAETAGRERRDAYNPLRGADVVGRATQFLDCAIPLAKGSHADVVAYRVSGDSPAHLVAVLTDGDDTALSDESVFKGFRAGRDGPELLLFQHNGLHIELMIDRDHSVGAEHPAGVCDVILESAVTTIEDCEDSVAAVDAEDKCRIYSNWLGLNNGTLEAAFDKAGRRVTRSLAGDREYTDIHGHTLTIPGRSLMLVRNVGIHMYTDAVLDRHDSEIPEGFLDAFVTVAAALHGMKEGNSFRNSRAGSVYVVKPKLHGPAEVEFTSDLFAAVEETLGLEPNTVKLGIMDEERRTTLNLKASIAAAPERVIFINTGFLDRTGDEIHTLMQAGPFIPKPEIKQARWMLAYEDWNVDTGLSCGLSGRAQIGKGMWAMPDAMADMLEQKRSHPEAGASTAWVPSPTAATLHAMHYHEVSVQERQTAISAGGIRARLGDLLSPSLLDSRTLEDNEIDRELRNNAQSILGYVVRWIDHGVGCSKVPDVNGIGLMEDRATLRISSQHIGNWLRHGLVSEQQVVERFREMAMIVDDQNASDPNYNAMAADYGASDAFQAALELALAATEQPNGYTEYVLSKWRRRAKAKSG